MAIQALQTASSAGRTARARIEVRGIVQGVGFRPFVYRLAHALALDGWVRNDGAGVTIEVQGDPDRVGRMGEQLEAQAPPRARVDSVAVQACEPRDDVGFSIVDSGGGHLATSIGPDSA